ncbi:MAG: aspartate aminotransferase family protein, partial [Rubrobacter sp.]
EVRGMGFFWGVEIRAQWPDGAPITGRDYQEYFKGVLPRSLLKNGLICRFDDKEDPVIQFSPALTSDREILSRIAEITDDALSELEGEIGRRRNRG